jgi:hypothetical protein
MEVMLVRVCTVLYYLTSHLQSQIYRLWIVWGRSWTVAALPAALTLFDLVAFIVILQRAARYDPASKQSIDLDIWTPLVFALEALTNLTCAGTHISSSAATSTMANMLFSSDLLAYHS